MSESDNTGSDRLVDQQADRGLRPLIDLLVRANRVLYHENIVDGMGHVSARHPEDPTRFLLSCSRAPGLVKRQDMMLYDLDGNDLTGQGAKPYLERFIHAEIYRMRPDVHSVVHSHSESVIPFGVTRTPLKPIFHMAGFLGQGVAFFDTAEVGDTDLLIRSSYLGTLLAKALGDHPCVLMRGHGSTVVGESVMQAVYHAVYTEKNSRLQISSMALGEPRYLSDGEAVLAKAALDATMERPFELWVRSLGEIELGEWPAWLSQAKA